MDGTTDLPRACRFGFWEGERMHLRDENASAITPASSMPLWPAKYDVLGVEVSATSYTDAAEVILTAARRQRPALVTALAVHGVVEASSDPAFNSVIRDYDMVTPDGQPVRIALNALHGAKLANRVAGPDLMLVVCERCAADGVGIYLYGSTERVVTALKARLQSLFPRLNIVGCEPSLFRPIQPQESRELAERINASGAGVVFVGLGCPLQERFSHQHRDLINAVQFCVGAAFDFHAGTKRRAPHWMREIGMEWFFRMMQEPRRLCKRYITTNATFIARFLQQLVRHPMADTEELETTADRAVQ